MYCSQGSFAVGPEYGHAWFLYKYEDFGNGFVNKSRANNKIFFGAKVKYFFPQKAIFAEMGLFYSEFQQYYSTKYYLSAWEERYPVVSLPLKIGKAFFKAENRFNISSSIGVSLNFLPEQYKAEYNATVIRSLNPLVIDSITRGEIRRDFGSISLLGHFSISSSYKISKNVSTEVSFELSKGVSRITEYDVFYNLGSGFNDKRAKQWGNGDNYSLRFSLLYNLKRRKTLNGN